ncbi:Acyltransferase [uncultured Thiomicrorhabdus sp.]
MLKKIIIVISLILFPWSIRRWFFKKIFGYQIHPKAFISRLAFIVPQDLIMHESAKIAAFTIAIHLKKLEMREYSSIGRSNWISGFPSGSKKHFVHVENREPSLTIGYHSAITKKHIIDCTQTIKIGKYSTIAGYQSQFLTHSIDYVLSRQDCSPIIIGDYCLVGTGCIFLPGTSLPNYSIVGAGSVVNKVFTESHVLYAGVPAMKKKSLSQDAEYFLREKGFVN